jgi:hypothetical protein
MQTIREPAGFSHVLVYGPSGVGKSTMMRQIAQRLNTAARGATAADAATFHRADYYRTALKTLGEPFFERRVMVDIDAEPTWEKKGGKTTRFQDSTELRHALEDALRRHSVRAVVLDEAQHLMHVGTGARLLDQLDWIKSMTNVTEVLHILLGTYDLLAFRNLSGQASRRSLDIHFARYQFQQEQDCRDFQGVLLALLQQVPLAVEVEPLMQHWVYFYERSIGCVGILKDWLVRAVATALHEGSSSLSLARIQEHASRPRSANRWPSKRPKGNRSSLPPTTAVCIYGACYTWGPCPRPRLLPCSRPPPPAHPVGVRLRHAPTVGPRPRQRPPGAQIASRLHRQGAAHGDHPPPPRALTLYACAAGLAHATDTEKSGGAGQHGTHDDG